MISNFALVKMESIGFTHCHIVDSWHSYGENEEWTSLTD